MNYRRRWLDQGQAKNVIINIPQPDNWQLIKETLKLRYRPDVEPHHLYRKVANLKVSSVNELMIEVQNIKYKADELTVYYRGDHYIDLSNMDSLLVNTIKEMTQGVLLDKIYDEGNLNNVIKIMTSRRFEDSCIRPEYRKFKTKGDNSTDKWNNKYPDRGQKYNKNLIRIKARDQVQIIKVIKMMLDIMCQGNISRILAEDIITIIDR